MHRPPKTRTRITGALTYWPLLLVIDYLTTVPLFVRTNTVTKIFGFSMVLSVTGIGAIYFKEKMHKSTNGWVHLALPSQTCRYWAALILLTSMANIVPMLVYDYWWHILLLTVFVVVVLAGLLVEIWHDTRPISQRLFE